ncbi:MAG: TolC family protein, partial [Planctomycetes bacterium]|nr:TolC family protein [Planctomycetota bacterium]
MIALRASRAAAAAALLAACTPEYRGAPELVLPPMAAPATDLRAWWQQFDDPQLIAVVERALEHNTDLVAAAGRVAEAAALVRNADDLLPDSSLRASAGRNQTSDRNAFPRFSVIDRANAFHTIGIDATWELDLWGRIRAGHDAAEADLLRSDALRDSLRASLAARTAQSYLRL